MSEASPPLRLVPPPPEGEDRITRAFSCRGLDDLQSALAAVAASGGPAFRFTALNESEETWLDTDDCRILGAGLTLRVDTSGVQPTARLDEQDRLVQRLELGPLEEAVRAAGSVGDRVRAVAGRHALDRKIELLTRRHRFEGAAGASRIELVFEEFRVVKPLRPGARVAFRLMMVGEAGTIDALAASLESPCELAPAASLVASIQRLEGIEPPAEPDLGSEEVGPGIPVTALAFVNLRRRARSFFRSEPGTRLGDDPEALHDMRVAGRRMRAALGLFEPYLPKRGGSLRRELGRLGRILGAVRDLDVQLEQLAAWKRSGDVAEADAFDAIEAVLVRKRRAARRRMLAALDGVRYERFVVRLREFLQRGPGRRPAAGRIPAAITAWPLVGRRYRAVRKAGERLAAASSPAEFHALRIRAKRLRYALEFHEPLYDGDVSAMIASLTLLQDLLGEHQDAQVAVGHLQTLAAASRRVLPPRALFLMGTIAGRYAHRAAQLRRAFPKTFRKIGGRRWKALKATLAKGAPRPAAPRRPS